MIATTPSEMSHWLSPFSQLVSERSHRSNLTELQCGLAANGHGVGLATQWSRVRLPAGLTLSGSNLRQIVHTQVPLYHKQHSLVPGAGLPLER